MRNLSPFQLTTIMLTLFLSSSGIIRCRQCVSFPADVSCENTGVQYHRRASSMMCPTGLPLTKIDREAPLGLPPTADLAFTACSPSQHEPLEESSSKVATRPDMSLPEAPVS